MAKIFIDTGLETQQELFAMSDKAKYITLANIASCSGHVVSFDTETSGLQWYKQHMIGIGIHCPAVGVSGYLPALTARDRAGVTAALLEWDKTTTVVGHNLKFDLHFVGIDAWKKGWRLIDTTVLVHLLDSRQSKRLADATEKYLGEDSKRAFRIKGKNKPVWEWPLSLVAEYCANDARITYELAQKLMPEAKANGLMKLFSYQMQYLARIWQVERYGIQLDKAFIAASRSSLEEVQKDLEVQLFAGTGHKFNWRSPDQLSKAIYEGMGIEKPKNPFLDENGIDVGRAGKGLQKSAWSEPATSSFILMEKSSHPLGNIILEMREIDKLFAALSDWENNSDSSGVVHSNFNITGTRTGRLSCSSPNLQNMPGMVRTRATQSVFSGKTVRENFYNLRQAFVPREGRKMVAIDYKQMEMRMFGVLAGDAGMLEGLRTGSDVHADVAERVWGLRDNVHREWAKTISFGQLDQAEVKLAQLLEALRGNQQPGQLGTTANGSETHSATRPVAAGTLLIQCNTARW
jgi:DNA polymerase-1